MREGLDLHVRETAVELVLETRGHDHARARDGRAARRRLRGPGDPLIETARLRLRRLVPDDLAALHAIRSREDVTRWLFWDPRTEDEVRAWIEGHIARPPEKGVVLAIDLATAS